MFKHHVITIHTPPFLVLDVRCKAAMTTTMLMNRTHLLSESPTRCSDPVLVVIVGRGAGRDEAHAGLVLGSHVAEELGGL